MPKIKLKRNPRFEIPPGYSVEDFTYQGRPAKEQDDFGIEVGIADMVHINKDGESLSTEYAPDAQNKYYHGGVVKSSDNCWWVYLEWGTAAFIEQSWINEEFRPEQEAEACSFQFVPCNGESQARAFFQQTMRAKNIEKIEQKKIGRTHIWVCKKRRGKEELETGYLVQDLTSRSRGLPHAYSIFAEVDVQTTSRRAPRSSRTTQQSQVTHLVTDLLAETHGHTRQLLEDSKGTIPTLNSINNVRQNLLPEVADLLKKRKTKRNTQLIEELSENIASIIPRPIPLHGTEEEKSEAILISANNIEQLEHDMDAFEAMIAGGLLTLQNTEGINALRKFRSDIEWISPTSTLGRWVSNRFHTMNRRNTHLNIVNMFQIRRDRCDPIFVQEAKAMANRNKRKTLQRGDAQPSSRPDLTEITSTEYNRANIIMGFHGTRATNIQPILASNLRLPTWSGLYGAGIYFATDRSKSHGYCGLSQLRGTNFMFICDVIIGVPHMTLNYGDWTEPPTSKHSIFFHDLSDDDEHIIFNPNYQRIRYLIEFE